MKTKKPKKYLYGYKFYINYGQGWEYEHFDLSYFDMKENRKQYLINCPYPLKITAGRDLNPNYIETL